MNKLNEKKIEVKMGGKEKWCPPFRLPVNEEILQLKEHIVELEHQIELLRKSNAEHID